MYAGAYVAGIVRSSRSTTQPKRHRGRQDDLTNSSLFSHLAPLAHTCLAGERRASPRRLSLDVFCQRRGAQESRPRPPHHREFQLVTEQLASLVGTRYTVPTGCPRSWPAVFFYACARACTPNIRVRGREEASAVGFLNERSRFLGVIRHFARCSTTLFLFRAFVAVYRFVSFDLLNRSLSNGATFASTRLRTRYLVA